MVDFAGGFGDLGSFGGGGKASASGAGPGADSGLGGLGMDSTGGDSNIPASLGLGGTGGGGLGGLFNQASPEALAQAQDPTGSAQATQTIAAGAPDPSTPGGGIGGTQSSLPAGAGAFQGPPGGVATQPFTSQVPGAIPGSVSTGPGTGAAGNIMTPGSAGGTPVVPSSEIANRFGDWTTSDGATGPTPLGSSINQSLGSIGLQQLASGFGPGGTNPLTPEALAASSGGVPSGTTSEGGVTTVPKTTAPAAATAGGPDQPTAPPPSGGGGGPQAGAPTAQTADTTPAPAAKTGDGTTTTADSKTPPAAAPPAAPGPPGTAGTGGFNPMQLIQSLLSLARMAMGAPPAGIPPFPPFWPWPTMPTGPGTPQPPTPQAPQPPTGAKAPEETGAGRPAATAGAAPATGAAPPPSGGGGGPQAGAPFPVRGGGPQAGAPTQDLSAQTRQLGQQTRFANFMGSRTARQMGINIRPGSPQAQNGRVTTSGGRSIRVNSLAAPHFQAFINELEQRGYKIGELGGYDQRYIRGGRTPSQHFYGNALDINPTNNWGGRSNLPADISQIAARHGLFWGGNWQRPWTDSMHFEWSGAGAQQPAAGGRQSSNFSPSLQDLSQVAGPNQMAGNNPFRTLGDYFKMRDLGLQPGEDPTDPAVNERLQQRRWELRLKGQDPGPVIPDPPVNEPPIPRLGSLAARGGAVTPLRPYDMTAPAAGAGDINDPANWRPTITPAQQWAPSPSQVPPPSQNFIDPGSYQWAPMPGTPEEEDPDFGPEGAYRLPAPGRDFHGIQSGTLVD